MKFQNYKKGYIPFYISNNFKKKVGKTKFQDFMGNLAKTWPNINVFILSDADSCKQINLKENDEHLKSDIDIAETFNSYFSAVVWDLENSMPITSISYYFISCKFVYF